METGCYNTAMLRRAATQTCKFNKTNIHFLGGIAMKKISMKQLLVNAMEEHGKNLILSDRF